MGEQDCSITSAEGLRAVVTLSGAPEHSPVDQKIADAVEVLLREPGVQIVYEHRRLMQWPTSGMYFMKRARLVSQPGYIPSIEDVLKSRVRTQGIVEKDFCIDVADFKIFD